MKETKNKILLAKFTVILFIVSLCVTFSPVALAQEQTNDSLEAYFQIGDLGPEITAIQTKLNSLGFDSGPSDGVFGNLTSSAVKAFQSAQGLEPTGIVDGPTYKNLLGRDIPQISRDSSAALTRRIIQAAMQYIGVPYCFGGTTPSGFDCSGFTRFVFANSGINLPRMADEQYGVGVHVPYNSLQPGDLVFFTTYTSGISHVGIYLGDSRFISATSSSGIKVTRINDSYWGPRYVGASRVL